MKEKPFDPKNPPKGVCEICLDPKHKTQHCESAGRIHYAHKKCWKKAEAALTAFIDDYYCKTLKVLPIEQRGIFLWLDKRW